MGNLFPFDIEQVSRQNMAMIERTMSLFSPFYRGEGGAEEGTAAPPTDPRLEIATLRGELARLQKELRDVRTKLAEVTPQPKSTLGNKSAAD